MGLLVWLPALPHDHSAPHHCAICDVGHRLVAVMNATTEFDPGRSLVLLERPTDDGKPPIRPSAPGSCRAPPSHNGI